MTHKLVEGAPIGSHPLVTRLLKRVYNSKPPQPRYSITWNVDEVVGYIRRLGDNDQLSLKILSIKFVLLITLVEAI